MEKPKFGSVIAVDFDGTCVDFQFPNVGKDIPGAVDVLKKLVLAGYKIVLWTCREDHPTNINKRYLTEAVKWFEDNGIKLHGVNQLPFEDDIFKQDWGFSSRKLHAAVYVDDKNIGGFVGWDNVEKMLL